MPVLLTGLEKHAITATDDFDWSAAALTQADALSDVDRLAIGP